MTQNKEKISIYELKEWNDCPYKHKLYYFENLKLFKGNEYTAFGTALHYVCEKKLPDNSIDAESVFLERFQEEISKLEKVNSSLVSQMRTQGKNICKYILPEVEKRFKNYEIISIEEEIYEPIEEFNLRETINFKGFIDLVLKTPDGKYHIIDWKTCSWGWDAKRKTDPMTVYQLSYYKRYFAKKHNIIESDISTYFILLKRTASKNSVEVVDVTNGPKRMNNSLNLLERALINIEKKNFIKNRLSCRNCEFYKTEHCK